MTNVRNMSNHQVGSDDTGTEFLPQPQRWIVVGHEERWRAAAEAHFAGMTHPMAKWRSDAALIVVTAPEGFEAKLRAAVEGRAPEVATFTQDGTEDLGPAFRRVFPVESPFTLPRLYKSCTLDDIEQLLREPEAQVVWRWLTSGRQRMPQVALAATELRSAARSAHLAWAEDYLRSWTENELDEMFGTGDSPKGEPSDSAGEPAGSNVVPIRARTQAQGTVLREAGEPGRRRRTSQDSFFRMAAQSRSYARPAGSERKADQVPRADEPRLAAWKLDLPQQANGAEGAGVIRVTATLRDAEWRMKGFLPPVLSIHAPGVLPILAHTQAWNRWENSAEGLISRCDIAVDSASIEIIREHGAAVRVIYRRSATSE